MAELREHRVLVRYAEPPSAAAEKPDTKEYYYVQDLITGFNKDCLEIKKWSVATASIVAIVGQGGLKNLSLVLLTILVLAFVFWITETIWRMNQWAFIRYVRQLELKPGAPQISRKWAEAYLGQATPEPAVDPEGSFRAFLEHFLRPRTFLPHGIVFGLAFIALASSDRWRPAAEPEQPQRIEGSVDVRLIGPAGGSGAAPAEPRR
ncbi:MAG TPA: hypothetical protein VGX37_09415 [Allosphingosinicella sp.]|jgi:hypothetical protein|nr:hypothetical protein [Allosphingosinicella sp.]